MCMKDGCIGKSVRTRKGHRTERLNRWLHGKCVRREAAYKQTVKSSVKRWPGVQTEENVC